MHSPVQTLVWGLWCSGHARAHTHTHTCVRREGVTLARALDVGTELLRAAAWPIMFWLWGAGALASHNSHHAYAAARQSLEPRAVQHERPTMLDHMG